METVKDSEGILMKCTKCGDMKFYKMKTVTDVLKTNAALVCSKDRALLVGVSRVPHGCLAVIEEREE